MTEQFISGYLEAISRVKDIITPHVGGFNTFFSTGEKTVADPLEHIRYYLTHSKDGQEFLQQKKADAATFYKDITLDPIPDWKEYLPALVSKWTCDSALEGINGQHGISLSAHLVKDLLGSFFGPGQVRVYKLLPDWGEWPWGDHMGEEFVFETGDNVYIMHFGEST